MRRNALAYMVALGFVALGISGCQSAPGSAEDAVPVEAPSAEDEPAAVETEEAESWTFDEEFVERALEWMGTQTHHMIGPFDSIEVRMIASAEALSLLEDEAWPGLHWRRDDEMMTTAEYLEYPEALVLILEGERPPLPPLRRLLVLFPQEGPEELGGLLGSHPLRVDLGVNPSHPRLDYERERPEENLERWPELDVETLRALLDQGERFMIFQHMTGCGASPRGRAELEGLGLPEDFPLYVDHDFEVLKEVFEDRRLRLPSSAYLAFDEGRWIDFHPSTSLSLDTVEHFFFRAGLKEEGPEEPVIRAEHFGENAHLALSISERSYWTSLGLPNTDLRGMRIWHGAISGSDFSGADLSEAILKNVLISRTSFEGADLTGATLENVELYEVVCVDGEVRSGDVEGCLRD